MPQTTKCVTCLSPKLNQADAMLVAGLAAAAVGRRLKLPAQGVQRHVREGHVARAAHDGPRMPPEPSGPPKRAQPGAGASEVPTVGLAKDMLSELRGQLDELNGMDLGSMSPSGRVQVMEAKRRAADSIARLEPPPPPEGVQVRDVDGMPEMFEAMHKVLERHPAVRAEMAAAFREAGLLGRLGQRPSQEDNDNEKEN